MVRNLPEVTSRGLALATVCVSAWCLGGVLPETQLWMARALSLCVLASVFTRESLHLVRVALPSGLLLLVAALCLGGLQLTPLHTDVVSAISPESVELMADFDGEADRLTRTLSISPVNTRRTMALLVLAIAAFYVGGLMFQTMRSQMTLCICLAINGVLLSIWGIVQHMSAAPTIIPGGEPVPEHAFYFSTWMNHSSAAGYLNLCLGAGMGWLLYTYRNADLNVTRLSDGVRAICQNVLTPGTLISAATVFVIVVGVAASLSRGGYVSAIVAFAVLFFILASSRRRFGSLAFSCVAGVIVIGVIGWVGLGERVTRRLSSLADGGAVENGRWLHWQDGLRVFENFTIIGSGLGTYQQSYLAFEQNTLDRWFQHAHNQYLETAADAGCAGLVLLFALLMVVGISLWKIRATKSAILHHWFAFAVMFGLVSQVVHAITDFGLYHPANMVAMALLCGSICGTASVFSLEGWPRLLRMPRFMSYPVIWGPACLLMCLAATSEIRAYSLSDRVCSNASDVETIEECDARLGLAAQALKSGPDDADLHLAMTDLLVDRFELQGRIALAAADPSLTEEQLDTAASLIELHRRIGGSSPESAKLRQKTLEIESVQSNLRLAHQHALLARRHSPLLARAHYRLAQLAPLFDESNTESIGRAARVARSDADMNFKLGLLHLHREQIDAAANLWQRSITLSTSHVEPVLATAIPTVPTDIIVNKILPRDPLLIVAVAARLGQTTREVRLRIAAANRAIRLVNESVHKDEPEYQYAMAGAHVLISRIDLAVRHMRHAVNDRPNDLTWRYEYAVLLWQLGKNDEARENLQWCLRLEPHVQRYRQLMNEIDQALQTASR